jgi:translation initiation factor IF-1
LKEEKMEGKKRMLVTGMVGKEVLAHIALKMLLHLFHPVF